MPSSAPVAATVAAAAITLPVFLLPGGAIQGGPTPLLPTSGDAAAHVRANLPVLRPRASRPVPRAAVAPALVPRPTTHALPQRREAVRQAQPARGRAPAHRVRRTVPGPPAAVTKRLFGAPRTHGKARGHAHFIKTAPRAHGHGRALGHVRSPEHGVRHGRGPEHEHGQHADAPSFGSVPGNGHRRGKT